MPTVTVLPRVRPAPSPRRAGPTSSQPVHAGTLHVVPWDNPATGSRATCFDVRSTYVERFWLPLVGPSSVWLLRRLADGLDSFPSGFDADLGDLARSLGLGGSSGRCAPLARAIGRCCRFDLARTSGGDRFAVKQRVEAVPDRLLDRLPAFLREQHGCWREPRATLAEARRRSRLLALDLAVLGEDRAGVERRLLQWGVHPALAYESAGWASGRPALEARSSASETSVRTPNPVPPFER